MIATREAISAAAFALLQGIDPAAGVQTFSRKFMSSADFGSVQMPALIFLIKSEQAQLPTTGGRGTPIRWRLEGEIFVFVSTNDLDSEPETQINNILDAIEKALAPVPQTGRQTLSGQVYDFRINGTIERDPGFISGVGAAAVPIEITTTS